MKTNIKIIFVLSFFTFLLQTTFAQNSGKISGDLNLNTNFYQLDTARDASGISFYDYLKSGIESWMSVKYTNTENEFEAGLRFDMYNNSNRIIPTSDFNGQGIGNWYISKQIKKLHITGGYFYDQFGSGALFRANELRLLGIDRSVLGIRVKYELNKFINLKAFAGKQKYLFGLDDSNLKGFNAEGYFSNEKITITPGIGLINRTLPIDKVNAIYDFINLQQTIDTAFTEPGTFRNNTFAASFYNTLNYKGFTWFVEYAAKTPEATNIFSNDWKYVGGNFLLTNLTYSTKGFGATLAFKRSENFRLRTDPLNTILQPNVWINYLPAINKEHNLLLLARYPAQSLELDDKAISLDLVYSPSREWKFELSLSNISLTSTEGFIFNQDSTLYRELFFDVKWKKKKSPFKLHTGFQILDYNDEVYRQKDGFINSLTPFVELTYKLNRKTALRFEAEYLMSQRNTRFNEGFDAKEYKQDQNDWYNALLELTVSPNWSFSVSDLYNINPADESDNLHFPSVFTSYSYKANRFSLFYGKRVAGIVCSGGVCRFEPAFSGVQFQLSTSF